MPASPLRIALSRLLAAHDADVDCTIDLEVVATTPVLMGKLEGFAAERCEGVDPVEWSRRRGTWEIVRAEAVRLARGS